MRPIRALIAVAVAAVVVGAAGLTWPARADSGPRSLRFQPLSGSVLAVAGVGAYRGDIVVAPGGGGLAVVDDVGFEDYLDGIAEVPPNWPTAALQAQAVAARTYALWSMLSRRSTAWSAVGADICATDACQVYAGAARDAEPGDAAWMAAVRATAGQVLLYRGRVIEAMYGSSDGGRTTYGGVPWLPSVNDPDDAVSPLHQWQWATSLASLDPVLGVPAGYQLTGLRGEGQVVGVTMQAPDGSAVQEQIGASQFHDLLNSRLTPPAGLPLALPSWRYAVWSQADQAMVQGWGFGHGVGMSQYGALGKALRGMDAGSILASYYGLRPTQLAVGQEPTRIRVGLTMGAPGVAVTSNGPFRVVEGSGRVLAESSGGTWKAVPAGSGVKLVPPSGYTPPAAPAPAPTTTAPPPPAPPAPAATPLLAAVAPPLPFDRGSRPSGDQRRTPAGPVAALAALGLLADAALIGALGLRPRRLSG